MKQWEKLKWTGLICKDMKKEEVDIKVTTEAWKNLGFNDLKLLTVMAFQEKVTAIGSRLARFINKERRKSIIDNN